MFTYISTLNLKFLYALQKLISYINTLELPKPHIRKLLPAQKPASSMN